MAGGIGLDVEKIDGYGERRFFLVFFLLTLCQGIQKPDKPRDASPVGEDPVWLKRLVTSPSYIVLLLLKPAAAHSDFGCDQGQY